MAGHSGVQGGYEAVVAGASKEAADTEVALTCGARRCTRRVARTRGDGGWCEQGGGGHGRSTPLYKAGVCGCDAKLLVAGASKEAAWTCGGTPLYEMRVCTGTRRW